MDQNNETAARVKAWLEENKGKYSTFRELMLAVMEELGIGKSTAYRYAADVQNLPPKGSPGPGPRSGGGGQTVPSSRGAKPLTEEEINDRFDFMYRLQKAVAQLKEGEFWVDADFRDEVAKIPVSQFRRYADSGEFEKYRGRAQNNTYWSHPKSIAKMKEKGTFS